MSSTPISRSPDLQNLRDDGYEVAIQAAHLVISHVPYVNQEGTVCYGSLVSALDLAGDIAVAPQSHVAYFIGSRPCHRDGRLMDEIWAGEVNQQLAEGLVVNHVLSSKPTSGSYLDYYEKITTYADIIASPARSLDPSATPKTHAVMTTTEDESVFCYLDTASSRAGIGVANAKLELNNVAIVGLGGTGSYVLDLVAKTPVLSIHLFDADIFLSHNAFRSPGAASLEELRARPLKVDHYADVYGRMRRNIVPHGYHVTASNADQLRDMDFVFLCIDGGPHKRAIVERLEANGLAFVDAGMGLHEVDGALGGIVRVTTSTPEQREHVWHKERIPFGAEKAEDDYARNIQIADLNALNAALAVIRWKKLFGFYQDFDREHFSAYTLDGNHLLNEDQRWDVEAA